jgi:hypothetical protein
MGSLMGSLKDSKMAGEEKKKNKRGRRKRKERIRKDEYGREGGRVTYQN